MPITLRQPGDTFRGRSVLLWLYLLNAAVLITHEIDSAFEKEWELFGLPGGVQLFLVLNFGLVVLILYGLYALARRRTSGRVLSWLLVAGGLFAVAAHSYFLARGNQSFRSPISLALLAATLVLSVAQAIVMRRQRRA